MATEAGNRTGCSCHLPQDAGTCKPDKGLVHGSME